MRVLVVLLLTTVALSGCTDGGEAPTPTEETVDKDTFTLKSGKGAIAGLLVDDRFRPLQLTDNPQTEFQAEGFILLQETGARSQTNENGEFTFVDLDPGRYTLRVSIEEHEAAPQQVDVTEGVFAEAQVLARRQISDSGVTISYEYAAFVACGANLVITGTSFDCTFDQSGDTSREAFTVDYSEYNATYLVMEMKASDPQYFDIWLQPPGKEYCDETYQILGGPETTYLRFQLELGEQAISGPGASGYECETVPWLNDQPVQTVVYLNSPGFEEGVGFGVGPYVGVQANFLQTVFIGEPDVAVDSFCAYCG